MRRLMVLSKEQLMEEAALLQKEIDELNKLKQYLYTNQTGMEQIPERRKPTNTGLRVSNVTNRLSVPTISNMSAAGVYYKPGEDVYRLNKNTERLAPLPQKSLSLARMSINTTSKDSIPNSGRKRRSISRERSMDSLDARQRKLYEQVRRVEPEKNEKKPLPAHIDPEIYSRLTKRKSITQDIIDKNVKATELLRNYFDQEADTFKQKKQLTTGFTFAQDRRFELSQQNINTSSAESLKLKAPANFLPRVALLPPVKQAAEERKASPSSDPKFVDKFEQRKRLFYGAGLMKDLIGRDSPGLVYDIDRVTGTMGN